MNGFEITSWPKGVKFMYKTQKVYQVEHDFWIYGANGSTKQDALETLKSNIRIARDLPDSILIHIVRGLQKIEDLSEEEFQENKAIFTDNEKIVQMNNSYCEYIELEKKNLWRDK